MRGKLIVFEGIDGSGKSTQAELLLAYLKRHKKRTSFYKFPQHQKGFFGKTLDRFLSGEFGELNKIPPHLISLAYSFDRASVRERLYQDLNNGKIIVCDRYVASNKAHQASRLTKKKRSEFLKWLDELDYKINQLPREDWVIYLDLPTELSKELRKKANRVDDIIESKTQKKTREVYLRLSKAKNWLTINCVDKKGNLKSREEIHQEIISHLKKEKVI